MKIVDRGTGTPVVLVPGIQGRWEWTALAVDALASRCRVITFSLADEPTSGFRFDESAGFDSYLRQIDDVLDAAGLKSAVICGISYGGLIAAAYAARRPERVSAVIVTSGIPPSWTPNSRMRFLMRAPTLLSPLFCIHSLRLFPEIVAARESLTGGLAFSLRHIATVLTHPFVPRLMARRVRLLAGLDLEPEVARIRHPALVVTGEAHLDRAVPVEFTNDYMRLWPHAERVTIRHAGHLGPITRAEEFASVVAAFAGRASEEQQRRRIG